MVISSRWFGENNPHYHIFENWMVFICKTLNSLHPRMLCGWIDSRKEDFNTLPMYFRYFVSISVWKRAWPFLRTNLNPNHSLMLCAKFGWNTVFTDRRTNRRIDGRTDRRRTPSDLKSSLEVSAHLSLKGSLYHNSLSIIDFKLFPK